MALVKDEEITQRTTFQKSVAILKPLQDIVLPKYLYYRLLSVVNRLINESNGAAQKNLLLSTMRNFELEIHESKDFQRRIANILSAYDDLIENNQRQIILLEEAAMRLYKEWFVQLRFPGHETTPIVDGVPEGWGLGLFENLCTQIKSTVNPKYLQANTPYIGLEHIPRKSICLNEWTDSAIVSSNKFSFLEDDVLFGKIRPYFHKVGFAIVNGVTSTDAMIFRAHDNMFGLLLSTAFSDSFVKFTSTACKEGAKMPRADWNEMKAYKVLIPEETILKEYDRQIKNLCSMIKTLSKQVILLRQARDKLLPKLMSGEIEV